MARCWVRRPFLLWVVYVVCGEGCARGVVWWCGCLSPLLLPFASLVRFSLFWGRACFAGKPAIRENRRISSTVGPFGLKS